MTDAEKLARDEAAKKHASRYFEPETEQWWKCVGDFKDGAAYRDASPNIHHAYKSEIYAKSISDLEMADKLPLNDTKPQDSGVLTDVMSDPTSGTDLPEGWMLQSNSWMIAKIETLHDIGSETAERMRYWRDRFFKLQADNIMQTHPDTLRKLANDSSAEFPEAVYNVNGCLRTTKVSNRTQNLGRETEASQAKASAEFEPPGFVQRCKFREQIRDLEAKLREAQKISDIQSYDVARLKNNLIQTLNQLDEANAEIERLKSQINTHK